MFVEEHVGFVSYLAPLDFSKFRLSLSLQALNIIILSVEKDVGSPRADGHSGASLPVAKHTLILVTTLTAFAMTRLF